ncbi:thermonuclease family protein [Donghicola tyrosinivorans]|uniref:Nuclease-like protein n=1 Tax=Donghicola tyrosinivorans TaxID=1652492 RepID=A0A2T0X508_9RHOB|nr:thermonuclease family protein [Donghicola tyrosinivorans]PRY94042.1 nuclease-like protein [Donghicola tyrosinivorans]
MHIILLGLLIASLLIALKISRAHASKFDAAPPRFKPSERAPTPLESKEQGEADRPVFDATQRVEATPKPTLKGRAWVTDGDTITINNTQIRLFGIDAPELNHPYGQKAKWALHRLCKGQNIRAEITDTDRHGRTVAKCSLQDGTDLSAEMVKLGMAIDWPKYSGGVYSSLETPSIRKKLFLANARQTGRMDLWAKYENRQKST